MLEFFSRYDAELISALLTVGISLAIWLLQPRVKLLWGLSHTFPHSLPSSDEGTVKPLAYTVSHIIGNFGRKSANNVEVTFNFEPDSFKVSPQCHYEVLINPENRYTIRFANLAPQEQYSLNLLTVDHPVPDLLSVRCTEVKGKPIHLRAMKVYSNRVLIFILAIIFLGGTTGIYFLIRLIVWSTNIS